MMVCITTATTEADAPIDARFGRSAFFTFVDLSTGAYHVKPNEFLDESHGVGTRVSQYVADQGAEAVITGHVGPKALDVLTAAGVAAYTTEAASVSEALTALREGRLSAVDATAREGNTE